MNNKKRNKVFTITSTIGSILGVIGSLAMVAIAYNGIILSYYDDFIVYISSFIFGFGVATIGNNVFDIFKKKYKRVPNNIGKTVFISFPENIDKNIIINLQNILRKYQLSTIDENSRDYENEMEKLRNVNHCFLLVRDELTPRQKEDVEILMNKGATIIPIIYGNETKLPTSIQNFNPISYNNFISKFGNKRDIR